MASKTNKIGLILCSTRTPRSAPHLASFVHSLLPPSPSTPSYTVETIDLLDWPLPLHTTEPTVPTRLPAVSLPAAYTNATTRAWSAHIASFDAFIFLCPQYNWGYPAAIKNAIDYLFHEWTGKPALVVSYGGRGGGLGRDQLVQVLKGLRMRVVEDPTVGFAFQDGKDWGMQAKAEGGEDLGDLLGDQGFWAEQRVALVQAFNELLALLQNVG
jgi:NAD(P)H-dependent FMN reductase